MKVHSFVAPKVTTPQQYFMMNASSQLKQSSSNKLNSTLDGSKVQSGNGLAKYQQSSNISFEKPLTYRAHQPSLDQVKNFMQPLNKKQQKNQKISQIPIVQAKINEFPSIQNLHTSSSSTQLPPQPKSLLRIGSMHESAVTDGGSQSKKLTFTQDLQQQFPVQSWKKQNLQNTFGYIAPPTSNKKKQNKDQSGIQMQTDNKNQKKKNKQPCCLLF